jgi:hypothetical protein
MVRPIDKAPICLNLEEVVVLTGYEALMEVYNNSVLIVWRSTVDSRPAVQASSNPFIRIYFYIIF